MTRALYARLLGDSWLQVAEPIRFAHASGPTVRARGRLRIAHGRSPVARFARNPEWGWAIAAVGLIGKTLGPIGMLGLIHSGAWPPSAFALCVTNDLIWWIPFGLYLHDAWPVFRQGA